MPHETYQESAVVCIEKCRTVKTQVTETELQITTGLQGLTSVVTLYILIMAICVLLGKRCIVVYYDFCQPAYRKFRALLLLLLLLLLLHLEKFSDTKTYIIGRTRLDEGSALRR